MKLTITHLKAPWPAGAKVGDVIELEAVPVWAAGKCTPADDGAEVTVAFAAKEEADKDSTDGARAALEAEAAALGVSFRSNISDETLAARIAEAKAAAGN